MARFKKVYIHIGLHKTGTTTLQQFLHANRQQLAVEENIYFPALAPNLSHALYGAFCDHPLEYNQNVFRGISDTHAVEKHREYVCQSLEQEFESASAAAAILSGEDLSLLTQDGWQRLIDWLNPWTDEIEAVCVVRDPLAWSQSAAQSMIKGGQTIEAVNAEPPLPEIRAKLNNAVSTLGSKSLRVYNFDELRGHPGGLVGGLCATFGISNQWISTHHSDNRNLSMSQEAALLISALNQSKPMVASGELANGRALGDSMKIIPGTLGQPFKLSMQAQVHVATACQPDLNWLKEELNLAVQCSDPSDHSSPLFSNESISSIAAQLLEKESIRRNNAGLTNQVNDMLARNTALRKDIEDREARNRALLKTIKDKEDEVRQHRQINEQQRQELHTEIEQLEAKLVTSQESNELAGRTNAKLKKDIEALENHLAEIRASTSWRITAPLRWLKDKLTGSS
ncbi:MAG: hypothetical protein ISP91_15640 [Pseudomonadales bacterium]|nr:hypothetical protein [Pseudomonadales bacterium]